MAGDGGSTLLPVEAVVSGQVPGAQVRVGSGVDGGTTPGPA